MASSRLRSLPLRAPDGELLVVAIDRQTRGIVSAILEALQAFQNDRNGAMGTNVTDNATHNLITL